jgi:PS-10 peptidase S37
MTSVYHRRFFPSDLDATVAYVAPLSYGLEDARYIEFIKKVGADTYAMCRDKLNELQRTVLTRRAEVEPRMTESYSALGGPAIALEHATLEMPFTFWQYQSPTSTNNGCNAIPAPDAPIATLYNYFRTVSYLSNFSDSGFQGFMPYYYQATYQLGAPGAEDAHLMDLLQHRETYKPAYYIPKEVAVPMFDADAMVDVQNWVKTEATKIIFIYGEYDPWSAGRFEIGTSGENYLFVAPGGNHGSNLARLSDADRASALGILQSWLGVPPVMPLDAQQNAFDDDAFHPRL